VGGPVRSAPRAAAAVDAGAQHTGLPVRAVVACPDLTGAVATTENLMHPVQRDPLAVLRDRPLSRNNRFPVPGPVRPAVDDLDGDTRIRIIVESFAPGRPLRLRLVRRPYRRPGRPLPHPA